MEGLRFKRPTYVFVYFWLPDTDTDKVSPRCYIFKIMLYLYKAGIAWSKIG